MIPMMIHTTSAPMNRMAISRISATMNPVKSYCRQQIDAARDMLAHGRGARFGRLQPQWLPIAISAVGLLPEQVRINPTYTRQTDLSSRRLVLTPDLIRGKPNDNRRSP